MAHVLCVNRRLADEMRAASGSGGSVAGGGIENFLLPPNGGGGPSGFSLFGEERPDRENLEASILPRLQRQLMEVEAEIRSAAGGVELAVHQLLEGLSRLDHGHVRWTELIQRAEEERRRVLQRVSSDYLLLQLKSSQLSFAQLDRLGRMMEGVDYRADLQRFVDVHAAAGGGQATPMRSSALRLLPIGIDDLLPTRLTAHLPAPSSPLKRDGSTSSQASQGEGSKSPTSAGPASPERRERAPSLSRISNPQGDKPAYDDKEVRPLEFHFTACRPATPLSPTRLATPHFRPRHARSLTTNVTPLLPLPLLFCAPPPRTPR
jgi:hypothetical protein